MARVAHGVAGAVILLEASTKFTEALHVEGALLAFFGVAMLLFAALHTRIHTSAAARYADTLAFSIEALVQGVIAWSYAHHGKHLLPWAFGAVCAWYVGLAAWRLMPRNSPREAGLH